MMKHYELTYLMEKNASPQEAGALFDKILALLPQATVTEKGPDFTSLEFYAEPEILEEMDKKLKSENQIKRFMISKKIKVKAAKAARFKKTPSPEAVPEQKVEKVELKEIDQKLKEIFGEQI